jgi:hypothetical protein
MQTLDPSEQNEFAEIIITDILDQISVIHANMILAEEETGKFTKILNTILQTKDTSLNYIDDPSKELLSFFLGVPLQDLDLHIDTIIQAIKNKNEDILGENE